MRTNYVIAAWTGNRAKDGNSLVPYLKNHLKSLMHFKHQLSQITVVLPYHENNYSLEAQNLKIAKIQDTPVVFMTRENRGFSYGSYSHVYLHYQEEFDYYIFVEDDYVYVKDNFDTILLELIANKPKCGFLCTSVKDHPIHKRYAAICNGIAKQSVLQAIVSKYGHLPYFDNDGGRSQVEFSRAFLDVGYEISDIRDRYKISCYKGNGRIIEEEPQNEEYLTQPIQSVWSFLDQL